MKKIYSKILLIATISIMVISCSSKKEHYTNVIPGDASLIFSINTKQIWDKSGFTEEQYQKFIQDAQKNVTSSETLNPTMEALIKDPSKSGLDFKEPIYFFTPEQISNAVYFLAKVSNDSDLKKVLENLPESGAKVSFEKYGSATVATVNPMVKITFDDNAMLICASQEEVSSDSLAMQLQGYKDKSINSNPAFKQMTKGNSDMAMLMVQDKIQNYMLKQMAQYSLIASTSEMPQYKDLYIISNLNFEAGRLHFMSEFFTENSETRNQMEQQTAMMGTLGDTFVSNFSDKTMFFMGININGEKYLDAIMKVYPTIANRFNNAEQSQKYLDAFKSIDGDVVMGVDECYPSQSMAMYMQVKNNSILGLLDNTKDLLGIKLNKVSENEYSYTKGLLNFVIGIKDNQLYAKLVNTKLQEDKSAKSLSASEWASTIAGSSYYMLLNVESTMNKLEPLIQEINNSNSGNEKQFVELLSKLSYAESYYNKSSNQFVVNICTKDTQTNILQTLSQYLSQLDLN